MLAKVLFAFIAAITTENPVHASAAYANMVTTYSPMHSLAYPLQEVRPSMRPNWQHRSTLTSL
ncbi:hypothetical protein GN958_ATG03224 [Phytophthora infestans]|uniref:Secreted RxLR effector peptide protein n=1 Tax=Phytophthora infestans TaxID=4787 RepID=A0A8S9V3N7_PHYIN|nr:hypothetical protein GN958_ATG03224 [Phytophthora infestans]